MRRVTDGVYRLGSSHHNFYVVCMGGRATIVDSGATRDFAALEEGLITLGLTFDDVEVMVITHAHTDHMGGAQQASQRGVEVKAHEDEIPVLSGAHPIAQIKPTHPSLLKPQAWPFVVAMLRAGALRAAPIPGVVALTDGEVLDVPGHPRVIHTPGHTSGHAAFYLEEQRTLFSGDALVTRSPLGGPKGPQFLDAAFHADVVQARESLGRLAGLDTELVLPGHGDPWEGQVADAVTAARGN